MKRQMNWLLVGLLLVSFLAGAVPAAAQSPVYEVVWPLGRATREVTEALAAHIPDLSGKTICGSGHSFKGDEVVPAVVELLQKQYPDIKFIPNADLPSEIATPKEIEDFQNIIKEKGCDVVLSGVGC